MIMNNLQLATSGIDLVSNTMINKVCAKHVKTIITMYTQYTLHDIISLRYISNLIAPIWLPRSPQEGRSHIMQEYIVAYVTSFPVYCCILCDLPACGLHIYTSQDHYNSISNNLPTIHRDNQKPQADIVIQYESYLNLYYPTCVHLNCFPL